MTTYFKRVPITVQAVRGKDDDLIGWVQSIPSGQRQQRIKDAIRAGIAPELAAPSTIERIDRTATLIGQSVEMIPDYFEILLEELRKAQPVDAAVDLSELYRRLADMQERFDAQLANMQGSLLNVAMPAANGQETFTPIIATERVDDAVLKKRESNLAKAKW